MRAGFPPHKMMSARESSTRLAAFSLFALIAAWGASSASAAPGWSVQVDEHSGLPLIRKGGIQAMSGRFVFWAAGWRFAGQQTALKIRGPFTYSISGNNPDLKYDLTGRITRLGERELVWDLNFDAKSASRDVGGGGMAFSFDLAAFGAELGEPRLLPDNSGWTWGREGGTRVEMRLDRPAAAVFFERGKKSDLRVFFYKGEVPKGSLHSVGTLTVSTDVTLKPTLSEQFGLDDSTAWPKDILSKSAPVDLSFLNAADRPAGKRGFVKAQGDQLRFDDGSPARFWGSNLTAYALFGTDKRDVPREAHRIAQLGFNLIRIHHHDSAWVNPNIFVDANGPDTRNLSGEMLERIDWWIKCLEDEGIYIWLDLNVGRLLKAGDGIQDFDEIRKGSPGIPVLGYNYVNRSIQDAMKRFDEAYLGHQNKFTGRRLKDDPGIVSVLITNENDLTNHYGNLLVPDKNVPKQSAIYMRESEKFAVEHSLPKDQIWHAWENGPSKLFLNDLEERFDADMIAHLRSMGIKTPIVTTSSWGADPLSSLPALTAGDIIDVHAYGGVNELGNNPLLGANLMHWMAAGHVIGKPLTVTEWGVEDQGALAPDRQDLPMFIAASAAMQGWAAVMFFAYAQEPLRAGGGTPSIYQAYDDPAMMASLPAAALLYRAGHVKEADSLYVFAPSQDSLFGQALSPANSVGLRTAAERGKLQIALPQVPALSWLAPSRIPPAATVFSDPNISQIADASASEIVSDSKELVHNWANGTFTINTMRTQASMGWIGGTSIALPDVDIAVSTRNAIVAVQSLDERPIRQSRSIMISVGARSTPASEHSLPFYSEPVEGTVYVKAPPGLALFVVRNKTSIKRVSAPFIAESYKIMLDRSLESSWLLLSAPVKDRKTN